MLAASVMPFFLALLATTGHRYEPVYMNFLDMFRQTLGATPAYFTLVAAAIFLAYAAARRTPLACDLLAAALVALSTVAPQTLDLTQLVAPRPLPLAAAGIVLGSIALESVESIRGALAASLLMIAATRGWLTVWPSADWTAVAIHVMIVGMAAIGAYFDDDLGELAQVGASLGLLVLGIASAVHVPALTNSLPTNLAPWHPLFVAGATVAYGVLVRDRLYFAMAGAILAAWVGASTFQSYQQLRRIVAGLDQIVFGLVFFLIAAAISLKKAGLWPRCGLQINHTRRACQAERHARDSD